MKTDIDENKKPLRLLNSTQVSSDYLGIERRTFGRVIAEMQEKGLLPPPSIVNGRPIWKFSKAQIEAIDQYFNGRVAKSRQRDPRLKAG